MLDVLRSSLRAFRSFFRSQRDLALENLALRHQLAVLHRSASKPRPKPVDRALWAWLSRHWSNWRDGLLIFKPATVVRWHRAGFRRYWAARSGRRPIGRPAIDAEVQQLVVRMSRANPLWEAPRINGELAKLGIDVAEATVATYMVKRLKLSSPSWQSCLDNHVRDLVSIDFFTVPTATFRVLFGFVVLAHDRRRVLHVGVTEQPSAEWTARQLVDTFPYETAPRYLVRDRDRVSGLHFRTTMKSMGIAEVITAARSPWQNPFAERWIGSLRRECLDHLIVLDEDHLRRILRSYVHYYNASRTHLSLAKDAPDPRSVQFRNMGKVIEFPEVGGLHHRYERRAA